MMEGVQVILVVHCLQGQMKQVNSLYCSLMVYTVRSLNMLLTTKFQQAGCLLWILGESDICTVHNTTHGVNVCNCVH